MRYKMNLKAGAFKSAITTRGSNGTRLTYTLTYLNFTITTFINTFIIIFIIYFITYFTFFIIFNIIQGYSIINFTIGGYYIKIACSFMNRLIIINYLFNFIINNIKRSNNFSINNSKWCNKFSICFVNTIS